MHMKMKHKLLSALLFTAGAFTVLADELPVDGNFTQLKNGKPVKWILHNWSGYQPFAKMAVKAKGDGDKNILELRDIHAKYGTAVITSVRFPGLGGDTVRVLFRARGKGSGSACLHYYTKTSRKTSFNRVSETHTFQLTPQWKQYVFKFTIGDGPNDETGKFAVCLGASPDSELDLSSIHAEHVAGKYRGTVAFPSDWTLYGPVAKDFVPTEADLNSIPEQLEGKAGRKVKRNQQRLDFLPLLGSGVNKCGWAFAVVNSPVEMDCTIGAGADWWMQVFVNGRKIFDTLKDGNVKSPVAMDNYTAAVRLKKGKNIIAAKLLTGASSAMLYLAGPNDLRSIQHSVKLAKIGWIEDFDGKTISCTGDPQVIQGNPTPGLLTLTGQGVFHTDSRLKILPALKSLTFPTDDTYASMGVRIQNFGQKRADSSLAMVLADGDRNFETVIEHKADNDFLKIHFQADGRRLSSQSIPYRLLPADFLFSADRKGHYCLSVNSLADSSSRCFRGDNGFFLGRKNAAASLELRAVNGRKAEITLDNYLTGISVNDNGEIRVPFKVDRQGVFDPVKAGWKLVFEDEFNGNQLDLKKWFYSYNSQKDRLAVRDGKLIISADWNGKKTGLTSASIYTHQDFLYGYFEAKVKFRKEHGWWSAFWLCTLHPSNSFIDGMEIDIYEDYYLRSQVPGGKPGNTLDHNLHMFANGSSKSWNYHSKLPGSIDDFYVIGCKWTPFEISYYMNGKLMNSSANHSPYDSVTFDPFHHGFGLIPLKAIVSGCCGLSGGDPKNGKFPEHFEVDYVRVYAFPQDPPQVSMKVKGAEKYAVPVGSTFKFSADVKPSEKTGAPITGVYLMDSGFTLDHKTKPPFDFEVKLTKEFYDTTQYVLPGRSRKAVDFAVGLHAYSIVAQDAKGNVAFAKPLIRFVCPSTASKPYRGKPAVLPGRLWLPCYDEGGEGVAYHDKTPKNTADRSGQFRPGEGVDAGPSTIGFVDTGEWLNYTVQIRKAGKYRAELVYGTPVYNPRAVQLLVDGKIAGEFFLKEDMKNPWSVVHKSVLNDLELPAGKHVLTLLFLRGAVNISHINFQVTQPTPAK